MSLNGSYTLSRCMGTRRPRRFNQSSAGYLKPDDPSFDAGYCDQDRTHLATLTTGYETPELANAALRGRLSHWRLSGILTARSGSRLNITERHRQRVHRHRQPAAEQGQRRLLRRTDADELLQPRRLRAAGGRHARRPPAQRRRRPELSGTSTWRCRGWSR